jgi:deoxyadenosine/deoxycytidine kinase
MTESPFLVGIVGACSAGKTTLVAGLERHGFKARPIGQEHSYVPSMWQRLTRPSVLIYLEVDYETAQKRRPLDWTQKEFDEQLHRLRHARLHADLYIDTVPLSIQEVLEQALAFLRSLTIGQS